MIAKTASTGEHDLCRLQLLEEPLRPGDAAEGEARVQGFRWNDIAAEVPDKVVPERESVGRRVVGERDSVGTRQRGNRFAQPSGGQQRILGIGGSDQHDIEVSCQPAVLEAVIQQV